MSEKQIMRFQSELLSSVRNNIDSMIFIEEVNKGLRPGTNYQWCCRIDGFVHLNFCLKPSKDYTEMELFIHDNSPDKQYSGLFKRIKESDDFNALRNRWGADKRASIHYVVKEIRPFTSWEDLEYAEYAGIELAKFINLFAKFLQ